MNPSFGQFLDTLILLAILVPAVNHLNRACCRPWHEVVVFAVIVGSCGGAIADTWMVHAEYPWWRLTLRLAIAYVFVRFFLVERREIRKLVHQHDFIRRRFEDTR